MNSFYLKVNNYLKTIYMDLDSDRSEYTSINLNEKYMIKNYH